MKNNLNVNISALAEIEIDIVAEKLFCQNRNVKLDGIIPGKVTTFEKRSKIFTNLPESRRRCYIFIPDPMNSS
jgi:hypothetical protein